VEGAQGSRGRCRGHCRNPGPAGRGLRGWWSPTAGTVPDPRPAQGPLPGVWVQPATALVDRPRVAASGEVRRRLNAVVAPSAAAAAECYPGVYGISMLTIPATCESPGTGTGAGGNGIGPAMREQAYWIDGVKNSCQSCHALGSRGVRNGAQGTSAKGDRLRGLEPSGAGWPGHDQHGADTRPDGNGSARSGSSPTGPTASPRANCLRRRRSGPGTRAQRRHHLVELVNEPALPA
jgi:hypothetical protein